jgi:hypothetical protein
MLYSDYEVRKMRTHTADISTRRTVNQVLVTVLAALRDVDHFQRKSDILENFSQASLNFQNIQNTFVRFQGQIRSMLSHRDAGGCR